MPNYKKSNNKPQINNDQQIKNQYINELYKQLKEEKDKNKKLIIENNNLKDIINKLNAELNQIKGLKEKLESELAKKNNEILKLLSQKNKNEDYFDLSSIKFGDKIITVNFLSMGNNDIGHYSLVCKKRDLFVKLEERLYNDFPQFKNYETYFEANGKRIKRFKTLEQNTIKNNDIINIFIIEE